MSAAADKRLLAPDDRLGLFATVAIVVGGIVGTGIFTVPAAIAAYGWLSVPAFAVVGAGSLMLALTFARLVRGLDARAAHTPTPTTPLAGSPDFSPHGRTGSKAGLGTPRLPSPPPATRRRCSGFGRAG